MKHILIIISLFVLLAACGQIAPASTLEPQTANLDHLITFKADGYATLHGRISGGSQCRNEDGTPRSIFIVVEMPVVVQGIETYVAVPFHIALETEIVSTQTPATSAQDFFATNPQASFTDAFALFQSVEIRFSAVNGAFWAATIRETIPQDPSQAVNLAGIFTTNLFAKGSIEGETRHYAWDGDDNMTWTIAIPHTLYGAPVAVLLPVKVTPVTRVVFSNGESVPALAKEDGDFANFVNPSGNLRIAFTLKRNALEVSRIVAGE